MALSLFLAKLIGLYLLIVGIIMILKKNQFEKAAFEMLKSDSLIIFAGALSLIGGLAIVIGHPIFEWSFRGVITFLGALSIFQGICRIGFFQEFRSFLTPERLKKIYNISLGIWLLLGVYLTYHGFMS